MKAEDIGISIKSRRRKLKMTQRDLALVSGLGVRFISDVENGKESCHLGKVLLLLETLGLKVDIHER